MLGKEYFKNVCEYANKKWNANLSESEIENQTEEMKCEYQASIKNGDFTHAIKELIYNFTDDIFDGSKEAEDILNEMMNDFKKERKLYGFTE